MIQPGESNTKAVRAVFFIDPKGIIRAIIYYPLSLGRNFDELYRAVIAMQTADAFSVATPADWRPGDEVIGSLQCYNCTHKNRDNYHYPNRINSKLINFFYCFFIINLKLLRLRKNPG